MLSLLLTQSALPFRPNGRSIASYAGMPTDSRQDIEAAARQLLSQGIKESVLVKRGSSGSLLVTKDGAVEQGIFKADKVNWPYKLVYLSCSFSHNPLISCSESIDRSE